MLVKRCPWGPDKYSISHHMCTRFIVLCFAGINFSFGAWFNVKMSSCQYRKSDFVDKTVVRLFYFHNGISYAGKMTSLYWIRALIISCVIHIPAVLARSFSGIMEIVWLPTACEVTLNDRGKTHEVGSKLHHGSTILKIYDKMWRYECEFFHTDIYKTGTTFNDWD